MAQLRQRDVSNFIPKCHISAWGGRRYLIFIDQYFQHVAVCVLKNVTFIKAKSSGSHMTSLSFHSKTFNASRKFSLIPFDDRCLFFVANIFCDLTTGQHVTICPLYCFHLSYYVTNFILFVKYSMFKFPITIITTVVSFMAYALYTF